MKPATGPAPRAATGLAALLVVGQAALLAWGAWRHSPVNDEVAYLPAGVSHWLLGNFDLARVSPPLIRLVAAVPVVLADPDVDWSGYADYPGSRAEWSVGEDFVRINSGRVFWLCTIARWACIPIVLIGSVVCYLWAKDLFGAWAGLLALALWCLCPTVLGNGQLMIPDAGTAALGLLAMFTVWHWLRAGTWRGAIAAGLALGIAQLAKTTLLVLYPVVVLSALAWVLLPAGDGAPRRALGLAQLAALLLISVYAINLGYGFEGSARPLGEYQFASSLFAGPREAGGWGNRFADTFVAAIPVPLPEDYVLGIDTQRVDFERGDRSYLGGEWRNEGWWYYYFYAFAVKTPLPTLLIMGWALARYVTPAGRLPWRDELALWLPAVAIVALVSSQTGFSHHYRYVLPALPFVFVSCGRVLRSDRQHAVSRWARIVALSAMVWLAWTSLMVYPHSLAYFNTLAGGPEQGGQHLLGSNISWGQNLLYLKDWYQAHPEARPMGLVYYGQIDPHWAGIEFHVPPPGPSGPIDRAAAQAQDLGPQPGWYAVDVNFVYGARRAVPDERGNWRDPMVADLDYTYFRRFAPVTRVAEAIYIYHLEQPAVDEVRRSLGLPALEPARQSFRAN